ncbi:hypothetical protein ACU4GD_43475 [Cupriavidus basilensis]
MSSGKSIKDDARAAEAAMPGSGLPKAPSAYNPVAQPEIAPR